MPFFWEQNISWCFLFSVMLFKGCLFFSLKCPTFFHIICFTLITAFFVFPLLSELLNCQLFHTIIFVEPFFHNHLVGIFVFWQLLDQHIMFLASLSSAMSLSALVFNGIPQDFCRVSDDSWSHNSATNVHQLSH
jgi:hypothetical protein